MELIRISCVLNVKPNPPSLMKVGFFLLRALAFLSMLTCCCYFFNLCADSEQIIVILCSFCGTPALIVVVGGLHNAEVHLRQSGLIVEAL